MPMVAFQMTLHRTFQSYYSYTVAFNLTLMLGIPNPPTSLRVAVFSIGISPLLSFPHRKSFVFDHLFFYMG